MLSAIDQTHNQFIKELLTLMAYLVREKNTEMRSVSMMVYPVLLFDALRGVEFIEAILVYEAMLMIISGTTQEAIDYKLNGIIGKRTLLDWNGRKG